MIGYGRGDDEEFKPRKQPWYENNRKFGEVLGAIFPIGLIVGLIYMFVK